MDIVRFDPALHPRNRRGLFIAALRKLKPSQKLRTPNGVEVTKDPDGGLRIRTATIKRYVRPGSLEAAANMGLGLHRLQDEADSVADDIRDIKPEDSRDFDTPHGPVTVTRALHGTPDGPLFDVSGAPAGEYSADDAAEEVAKRRLPDPAQSVGTADLPMGKLTAISPFTFGGKKHQINPSDTLDVLRQSGAAWVARHKSGDIGLLTKAGTPAIYTAIWPPLAASPGTKGVWKDANHWDVPPPGTVARWHDDAGTQRHGTVTEFDADPPGQYVIAADDGSRHIVGVNNTDASLQFTGDWPAADGNVAKARHLIRQAALRRRNNWDRENGFDPRGPDY